MLQTSKSGIQDSGGAPRLTNPYLGPCKLTDVKVEDITSKDGKVFENCLIFTFTLEGEDIAGNDVSGFIVQKTEWPIRQDDDQQKTQNKLDRVGYILKYIVGEEKAASVAGRDWAEYAQSALQIANSVEYSEIPLRVKVVGDTYGTPSVEIPNYRGFLEGKDSSAPIAFSPKEERKNAKYMAAKSTSPDSDDDLMGTDEDIAAAEDPFAVN